MTRDRARDPWSPYLSNCHPFLKDKGKRIKDETENGLAAPMIAGRYKISAILAIWPIPDKEFAHPSA